MLDLTPDQGIDLTATPIQPTARRQWGSDRRKMTTSSVAPAVSDLRLALGRLAIVLTLTAWCAYFATWLFTDLLNSARSTAIDRAESVVYLLIITLPTASAVAYLLSRLGFFYRARSHHRLVRLELEEFYDISTPTLTFIVPSYQEEARVIRSTLLSAALQEYPQKRIVLLIDDPATPRIQRARELLDNARALPGEIEKLLAVPAVRFARALKEFDTKLQHDEVLNQSSMDHLADTYQEAVRWLEDFALNYDRVDHSDEFLVNEVILRLANGFATVREAVIEASRHEVVLSAHRFRQLYRRLAWTFEAEITSFERKRFINLSGEPNKASNLNSFIGLMGGEYQEVRTPSGLAIVPCSPDEADLKIPNPDYVLTLDADSILLPEYSLILVHQLERTEHQDVAIAQTPYSAFPGAATRLERIAGATTDLQYLVHQGLTYYDATFWVGANAVIRKAALDQIGVTAFMGDWEIRQYIKDRTVIEDTESTIDLRIHGWRLFNYPERLSYSATPPDFGSLCIQRRRWANGGLLILPRLRQKSRSRRAAGIPVKFNEQFLQWNYMASICWSTVSLLILLAFPFRATLISPILGLVVLPYFLAMASDLRYCGYKGLDVARVYGLNLILLPVNLAGTISSLTQGITASKSAFVRTPKVSDRTVTPALFVLAPYALIALSAYTLWVAYTYHLNENMAYASVNILLTVYAIVAFVGIRNSVADMWIHFKSVLYKHPRTPRIRSHSYGSPMDRSEGVALDWQKILMVGPIYTHRWENTSGFSLVRGGSSRWELTGQRERMGTEVSSFRDFASGPNSTSNGGGVMESDNLEKITFRTLFQPVFDLASGEVVGFEALSRFDGDASALQWLELARRMSASTDLEGALARAAIEGVTRLPKGGFVAINVSLALLGEDLKLIQRLGALGRPVVVEMSSPPRDDTRKALSVASSLPANVVLALDHVGLDEGGLSVVSLLHPALVKLQPDTVRGISANLPRQAQIKSIIAALSEFGGQLQAVGIETSEELRAMRELGVQFGQGFLLGRPSEFIDTSTEVL